MIEFSQIVTLAKAIHTQIESAQYNSKTIRLLNDRINTLLSAIEGADEMKTHEKYQIALEKLYEALQNTLDLVTTFRSTSSVIRFLKARSFKDQIKAINDLLTQAAHDLTLGGVMQGILDRELDNAALLADLDDLRQYLETKIEAMVLELELLGVGQEAIVAKMNALLSREDVKAEVAMGDEYIYQPESHNRGAKIKLDLSRLETIPESVRASVLEHIQSIMTNRVVSERVVADSQEKFDKMLASAPKPGAHRGGKTVVNPQSSLVEAELDFNDMMALTDKEEKVEHPAVEPEPTADLSPADGREPVLASSTASNTYHFFFGSQTRSLITSAVIGMGASMTTAYVLKK